MPKPRSYAPGTSDRAIVAAAFRGQLTKPVRELSPAYIARLAREARAARAEGRAPQRQAGRGHRPREVGGRLVTTEHPKEYVRREGQRVYGAAIGKAKPSPIRRGPDDRHVETHATLANRDFRSGAAAWRWLRRFGADAVQAIAHGIPQPEYGDLGTTDDEAEPERIWRVFYTGTGEGDADENGQRAATYAQWQAALYRVFLPGSVDAYIIRRQA